MRDLLSISDLTTEDIHQLLELAQSFAEVQGREVPKVPALRGKTIVLAFFEDSTRTRTSFDLAARRLSADVVNFAAGSSATKKGESIRDTVETIASMGIDGIVVRHGSAGVPNQITQWTEAAVINAGDGCHQHPTQALADCFTIKERLGTLEGKRITICGDIEHSRVARSNVQAFSALGAEVILVAPKTLLPLSVEDWPAKVEPDLDAVLPDADVAYFLRIQKERLGQAAMPSDREYRRFYGMTSQRMALLPPDALLMHPGPVNRGVELDPEVLDDSRSAVLDQVASGVPVRMAVLFKTLGPGQFKDEKDEHSRNRTRTRKNEPQANK